MVEPGYFRLYDAAVPDLKVGEYDLVGDHELGGENVPAGAQRATEQLRARIGVRSFRYELPPDQILSVWPAANSEGAFESRLPQIAIRRRTLPWDRDPGGAAEEATPWLALVVIAEGEGTLVADRPVEECVTPGTTLEGRSDSPTGSYLAVTESVVEKVFPTEDDLRYLTHVREVDIADTELAMGDDDGFLAVVLANRLPLYDRDNCKPVRYLACLVNLEQQLDALPKPRSKPAPDFEFSPAVMNLHTLIAEKGGGGGAKPQPKEATREVERKALSADSAKVAAEVRGAMAAGFRMPIGRVAEVVKEKLLRFPVLAHWSFTCTGSGEFRTLMKDLDVGLLGTVPADPAARKRLECLPDGEAAGPPPEPRPPAELTETGHVGLDQLARRGERARAWYRGPLGPHATERGGGSPAHVGDQLRRVVEDGREDLGYAAAFEIGRLLALSRPALVAALLRWRHEHFGAERARRKAALGVEELAEDSQLGAKAWEEARGGDLGRVLGRGIVLTAAADPGAMLGPSRPLVDPGRPLTGVDEPLEKIIAEGFELPVHEVRTLIRKPLSAPPLAPADLRAGSLAALAGRLGGEQGGSPS